MATKTTTKTSGKPVAAAEKKAGTAVAVRKPTGGAIVDIQAKLREQAAAMADRTAPPSGSRIQVTQDKKFKLPNGQTVNELDAVIVDFRTVRNFYESAFDAKNITPPACFAIAVNPKDSRPSSNSPKIQNDICNTCPMNQFGSDGDGKACKEGRKMALLPPNDAGDDVDAEADLWTLTTSPTAVKGFDGFVQTLARTFSQPPVAFLVKIDFDESVTYAKLRFSEPRPIASVAEAFARQEEARAMLEAEPDVSGYEDPASKAPAAKGRAAPAKGARR